MLIKESFEFPLSKLSTKKRGKESTHRRSKDSLKETINYVTNKCQVRMQPTGRKT